MHYTKSLILLLILTVSACASGPASQTQVEAFEFSGNEVYSVGSFNSDAAAIYCPLNGSKLESCSDTGLVFNFLGRNSHIRVSDDRNRFFLAQSRYQGEGRFGLVYRNVGIKTTPGAEVLIATIARPGTVIVPKSDKFSAEDVRSAMRATLGPIVDNLKFQNLDVVRASCNGEIHPNVECTLEE